MHDDVVQLTKAILHVLQRRQVRQGFPMRRQPQRFRALRLQSGGGRLALLQRRVAAGAFLGEIHLGDRDQDFSAGFQVGRL